MSTVVDPPVDEASASPGGRGMPRPVLPLVLRLHFYAGVLVAPFLVVAALTGLAFVLTHNWTPWPTATSCTRPRPPARRTPSPSRWQRPARRTRPDRWPP